MVDMYVLMTYTQYMITLTALGLSPVETADQPASPAWLDPAGRAHIGGCLRMLVDRGATWGDCLAIVRRAAEIAATDDPAILLALASGSVEQLATVTRDVARALDAFIFGWLNARTHGATGAEATAHTLVAPMRAWRPTAA